MSRKKKSRPRQNMYCYNGNGNHETFTAATECAFHHRASPMICETQQCDTTLQQNDHGSLVDSHSRLTTTQFLSSCSVASKQRSRSSRSLPLSIENTSLPPSNEKKRTTPLPSEYSQIIPLFSRFHRKESIQSSRHDLEVSVLRSSSAPIRSRFSCSSTQCNSNGPLTTKTMTQIRKPLATKKGAFSFLKKSKTVSRFGTSVSVAAKSSTSNRRSPGQRFNHNQSLFSALPECFSLRSRQSRFQSGIQCHSENRRNECAEQFSVVDRMSKIGITSAKTTFHREADKAENSMSSLTHGLSVWSRPQLDTEGNVDISRNGFDKKCYNKRTLSYDPLQHRDRSNALAMSLFTEPLRDNKIESERCEEEKSDKSNEWIKKEEMKKEQILKAEDGFVEVKQEDRGSIGVESSKGIIENWSEGVGLDLLLSPQQRRQEYSVCRESIDISNDFHDVKNTASICEKIASESKEQVQAFDRSDENSCNVCNHSSVCTHTNPTSIQKKSLSSVDQLLPGPDNDTPLSLPDSRLNSISSNCKFSGGGSLLPRTFSVFLDPPSSSGFSSSSTNSTSILHQKNVKKISKSRNRALHQSYTQQKSLLESESNSCSSSSTGASQVSERHRRNRNQQEQNMIEGPRLKRPRKFVLSDHHDKNHRSDHEAGCAILAKPRVLKGNGHQAIETECESNSTSHDERISADHEEAEELEMHFLRNDRSAQQKNNDSLQSNKAVPNTVAIDASLTLGRQCRRAEVLTGVIRLLLDELEDAYCDCCYRKPNHPQRSLPSAADPQETDLVNLNDLFNSVNRQSPVENKRESLESSLQNTYSMGNNQPQLHANRWQSILDMCPLSQSSAPSERLLKARNMLLAESRLP